MSDLHYSAFFSGLSVGVGLALLFAPRTGRETRDRIADKATEGKNFVQKRSVALRESAADLFGEGKDTIRRNTEDVREAFNAG